MHIPNHLTPDTDIVIFGHTHMFEIDYKNETLFLIPTLLRLYSKIFTFPDVRIFNELFFDCFVLIFL